MKPISEAMPIPWDPQFCLRSPMFAPLAPWCRQLRARDWPDLEALNALLAESPAEITTGSGARLRFVPPAAKAAGFCQMYEPRIFLTGEVQTRAQNWHDFFNALAWLAFPKTKAALNTHHYAAAASRRKGENRSRVQDALTLFDEGGVIVACGRGELAQLLRAREWKELFWKRREETAAHMRFTLFGHALYEKALAPYRGVSARALILETVDHLPRERDAGALDAAAAGALASAEDILRAGFFTPLPVLGVPGWARENEAARYYDDARYFRSAPASPAHRTAQANLMKKS